METYKTFEIFKSSSNDCLEWSNKDWKALSKNLPTKQTLWKTFSQNCLAFPENGFNFVTHLQKTKKCPFQMHTILVSSFRKLQNHFRRSSLWPNFDLSSFERFASLSQKMVLTLSLENLQKSEKCSLQTLSTFVFELPMTKFWISSAVVAQTRRFFSNVFLLKIKVLLCNWIYDNMSLIYGQIFME